MAEYDLDFAVKLAAVADQVEDGDPWAYDARRVAIYLARLSAEITLKALLEQAGVPISKIRRRSHNLRELLRDLDDCEVEVDSDSGPAWKSASIARETVAVDLGFVRISIGEIIDAEDQGASRYPNEIRYGEAVTDFNPAFVTAMASRLAELASKQWRSIRYAPKV